MSKKRVSYQNLLKQAISEFDTSKTVDVKGPMLDPILKWEGDGELPIYKDAASILERYYFDEQADKGVEVDIQEGEANDGDSEDGTEKATDSEKDAEGAGTEQAGTSAEKTMPARKSAIAKDLAKEDEDLSEKEWDDKDVPKKKKYVDEAEDAEDEKEDEEEEKEEEMEESTDMSEDIENAVIEKLIAEMEEEDDEEESDEEEVEENIKTSYEDDGVAPGMEAPKEKKASGPEEDTEGAGTEQAGTGTDAGQVPDRKDNADKMVKPKNYNEQEEKDAGADEEADDSEEAELDVDAEVKESSAVPGGPSPKKKGEDWNEDVYEEAFKIFQEAIEDDEE